MMGQTEYRTLADRAIEKYRTLRAALPQDANIVYVVSPDILEAMETYDRSYEDYNADDGVIGAFWGERVGCINEEYEDEIESFFMPVVYSRTYQHYPQVQVGDYVLYYDGYTNEDCLFRLEKQTPEYIDTGFTVSFVESSLAACDNRAADYADCATMIGDAIISAERNIERIVAEMTGLEYVPEVTIDIEKAVSAISYAETQEVPTAIYCNSYKKDKELNPGDTEMIDNYLHSFLKGGC